MLFLNIVVPCYNEEQVIAETARRLSELLDRMIDAGQITDASGIYFVDDGSRDRTWPIVLELGRSRPERFHGIKLSRNQGHQKALLAGLRHVPGDALISVDADLQDDINLIPEMVERHVSGNDIVYAVRSARRTDSFLKRRTAETYYRLLRSMGVEIVFNHADYRLMSRRALDALARYEEVNLFLRAIVPLLGFRTAQVFYDRSERLAGESKYPVKKMVSLAVDGITSFSMRPLRLITALGFTMAAVSFVIGCWAIAAVLFSDRAVPGWASILVPSTFVGGLQLLSLGVIGEYIGKIFLEVKRRPLFEIEDKI